MEGINLTDLFETSRPPEGGKTKILAQKIARADQDFAEMLKVRQALKKAFTSLLKKQSKEKAVI